MISQLSVNKPNFLHSLTDSYPKTWQPSPKYLAKCSNRTFPKRKRGRVENGVQIFLLTASGDVRETPTGEFKRQDR